VNQIMKLDCFTVTTRQLTNFTDLSDAL